MDKLKMHSPNLTEDNIAKLAELFPSCVTEARDEQGGVKQAIDFDQLRQELSKHIVEGPQERYHLNWPGKREALLAANAPIAKTLRPCREESVDFDNTKNLFIEGDNLEALKLLQETYLGKVKMIYIDPPYNTGGDFIYNDKFSENVEEYLLKSNQKEEDGSRLSTNLESNGRFHSDWLSMIFPRLKFARNLLSDDGVIFVSIDDNEAARLKLLMDEVFGESNHLVTHYIQVRYESKTLAEKNNYQKLIEQVLVYKKESHEPIRKSEEYKVDKFCWKIVEKTAGRREVIGGREVDIFQDGEYEIIKEAPSPSGLKETWATGTVLVANASGKYFGNNLAPRKSIDGLGALYKVYGIGEDGLGYRYFTGPKRESATKGKFFSGIPLKRKEEIDNGGAVKFKPIPNFYNFSSSFGNCRHEGGIDFRGGKKPVEFISELIGQAIEKDEEAIVFDFFGGSGSTAHAVMKLNSQDGGNRRFIVAQIPEKSEDSKYDEPVTEICKKRIKTVCDDLKNQHFGDFGFRAFKIDSSNYLNVYYSPDVVDQESLFNTMENIRPERTAEDLLFQVLLDWGVDLSLPVSRQELHGKTVFFVDGAEKHMALAACFDLELDEAFVKQLAEYEPLRVVFRDAGFASDSVKINVEQIFAQKSPNTDVKVI